MAYVCLRYEYTLGPLGHVPPEMKYQKKRPNDSTVGAHNLGPSVGTDPSYIAQDPVPTSNFCVRTDPFLGCFLFKDHEMKVQKDTGDLIHTKHPAINRPRLLNC